MNIKSIIIGIKNLIIWFPVIWRNREWDHHYYEEILLHKIKLQIKYFEKTKFFVGWEREVKWMKVCEYLLTMILNNTYWTDEWNGKKPSNRGFSEKYLKNLKYINDQLKYSDFCGDLWEDKTRTLFWKIFIWRYEYWWD